MDQFGKVTQNVYDATGSLIETLAESRDEKNDPVTLITQTVYDNNGRAYVTTDPYVEGVNAHLKLTHYVATGIDPGWLERESGSRVMQGFG